MRLATWSTWLPPSVASRSVYRGNIIRGRDQSHFVHGVCVVHPLHGGEIDGRTRGSRSPRNAADEHACAPPTERCFLSCRGCAGAWPSIPPRSGAREASSFDGESGPAALPGGRGGGGAERAVPAGDGVTVGQDAAQRVLAYRQERTHVLALAGRRGEISSSTRSGPPARSSSTLPSSLWIPGHPRYLPQGRAASRSHDVPVGGGLPTLRGAGPRSDRRDPRAMQIAVPRGTHSPLITYPRVEVFRSAVRTTCAGSGRRRGRRRDLVRVSGPPRTKWT